MKAGNSKANFTISYASDLLTGRLLDGVMTNVELSNGRPQVTYIYEHKERLNNPVLIIQS